MTAGYSATPRGCSRCGTLYTIGTQAAPWLCHPCVVADNAGGPLVAIVPPPPPVPATHAIGQVGIIVRAAGAATAPTWEIVVRGGSQQVSFGGYASVGSANVHAGWLAAIIRRAVQSGPA